MTSAPPARQVGGDGAAGPERVHEVGGVLRVGPGILVIKGRMQTAGGLTDRCRRYIAGIRAQYHAEAVPQMPSIMPIAYVK